MKHLIFLVPFVVGLMTGNPSYANSEKNYQKVLGKQRPISVMPEGGSGVGGGNIYSSLIYWCNEATIILQEAKAEAIDLWGYRNDRIGAIKTFYEGLLGALKATNDEEINYNSSVSYRVITRGIKLSQSLGVPQVIDGDLREYPREKDLEEVVSFMNFYYEYTSQVIHHLDKKYYAPYIAAQTCKNNCNSIPTVQTLELEREMVKHSTSLLSQWRTQFIKGSGALYSTLSTSLFLKGLSYLTKEVADDLSLSLFNQVYMCQEKQLRTLNNKIQFYLNQRGTDSSLDAVKLNQFVTRVDEIIKNIEMKECR